MINAATFQQTLRNAVLIPLVGLVLLVAILFIQVSILMEAVHWTEHTYQVIVQVRTIRNAIVHAQSAQRGFFLTDDGSFLRTHSDNSAELDADLKELRRLVSDNKKQTERLGVIDKSCAAWKQINAQEQSLYQQKRDYRPFIAREQVAEATLESQLDTFRNVEEKLLTERYAAAQSAAHTTRILVAVLALLLSGVMGSFIRRQMLSLAGSYNSAMASLQNQTDTLQRNADEIRRKAEEIKALNTTLEERVEERTAQLEASNKELEAFSYSVSHDLRAPLRSIDGFSQALMEDYGEVIDAEGKKYLDRIRNNSRQMAGLIDDLLNLSRLTRMEIKRAPVDLSAVAQTVAEALRQRDPARQVTVEIAEPLPAEGDERLLRIALENLIGNAWKFTSKIPDARIQVGATEQDGKPVYFVRDNGAGFDMAYADKLFGAFQRLHKVDEFEGTGIGLATVQRVIRRHNGRIWAESEVGKGATFYFTLE